MTRSTDEIAAEWEKAITSGHDEISQLVYTLLAQDDDVRAILDERAVLIKKANFNEGLRDIAMRELAIANAKIRELEAYIKSQEQWADRVEKDWGVR